MDSGTEIKSKPCHLLHGWFQRGIYPFASVSSSAKRGRLLHLSHRADVKFKWAWHSTCWINETSLLLCLIGGQTEIFERTLKILFPYLISSFPHYQISQELFTGFWWLSGKEFACQCRRQGFVPWSGKMTRAMEQLSLCATTIEPVLWSWGATTIEPRVP